jgi:hypothetical protein
MKKSIISLCLLTLATATNVSAETPQVSDVQQLNEVMSSLEVTEGQMEVFADIHNDENYAHIQYVVHKDYSEIYVTPADAKKMELEKVNSFYVYGHEDLDVVMAKIASRIDQDKPTFFSVDLYRNYLGHSGNFKFVAEVVEYK